MSESGNFDWLALKDRVCVITGAGGGIGRAIATDFARAGGRIVLLERDQAGAEATVADLRRLGSTPELILCDVSDPQSVEKAAAKSEAAIGPCDVLINNAGLLKAGPLETLTLAEWNMLLAVNLTGYFLCAQAFGRQMRRRSHGSIVHVASIAASHAQGFSGAYSVSKAGIVMLSRQLAIEWGSSGVRSNVVSPGMIVTPLSQPFYDAPGVTEKRSAMIPVGRIGQPADIADAVLFLASDRAAYITGDEIIVDGGFGRMLMSLVPRPGYDGPQAKEAS